MPGRGIRVRPSVRLVAVCVLLAITVIGLGARGPLTSSGSPGVLAVGGRVLFGFVVFAEAVSALTVVLLIAGVLRARRTPASEEPLQQQPKVPVPWWVQAAVLLSALVLLAVPVALLLAGRSHAAPAFAVVRHGGRHGRSLPADAPSYHLPSILGIPWPILVAAVAAGLIAVALARQWRRRVALAGRESPAETAADVAPRPVTPPWQAALAAGTQALTAAVDPRAAIVGCYAAMERSLAAAGAPPAAADTPAEVLDRARGHGLLRSPAAGTLTGLFRRARYSTMPMAESDRSAALGALARLREELAERGGRL